jgi:hypothetical protein
LGRTHRSFEKDEELRDRFFKVKILFFAGAAFQKRAGTDSIKLLSNIVEKKFAL